MIPYTLLFLSHTLGDYYLQPQALARLKSKNTAYVLIHAAIYAGIMFLSTLLYPSKVYFGAVVVSCVTHAIIDIVKQLILNHAAKQSTLSVKQERLAYIIDQVLHMTIILACALFTTYMETMDVSLSVLNSWCTKNIGINGYTLLSMVAALLAVMKSANVFIQKILVTEKPSADTKSRLNFGGRIGNLERLITMIMLFLGQYTAVALVFTAKSIVRFKDFENRDFAEYYLYGTLLSVVTALIVYGLMSVLGA